jgi:electron transfer flavoprotein alpha subunit
MFNRQSKPEPDRVAQARGSEGECKTMSNVIKAPTSAAAGRAATKKQLPDRFKAYKHVWVFVEQERGQVHPVSWELMGAGRKLADRLKVKLAAVVVGPEGEATRNAALEAFCYGADLTYLVADNVLSDYRNESYTKALSDLVEIYKPEILLLGATTLGRDLAGSVATTVLTGLTADCTDLDVDADGSLAATRPTFGGSLLCTIYTLNYRPQMATVRPRVMPMPERVARDSGRIILHPLGLVEDDIVTKVLSFIPDRDSAKSNLAYADVVVAGGLGLGSQENFQLVRQLATVLGAEYGCSRPLVQKGWVTYDRQIGQTGKTIRPKLYIAAGVSGAIQHRVGVEGADLIVAINTDKNAPIFDFAHIAIVSDAMHLLPALTDAFRARLSPHSRDRIAS